MRALFRPVSTLLFAPLLFVAVVWYLRNATGSAEDSVSTLAVELKGIYSVFTLPALGLMLLVLLPVDLLLRRTGFGLLTVIASPLVAILVVVLLRHLSSDPHVQQWGAAVWLVFCYGLTWGLTIRDPRTVMAP